MPKKQKQSKLPKVAPKRTGKRGVGPKHEPEEEATEPLNASSENGTTEKPKGEPLDSEKKPRQARLPEMQDPEIEELEAAAEEYASIRDQRMALNEEEHELKMNLLNLMHQHNKKKYIHEGVEIRVVVSDETVKVKIKKEE